MKYLKIIFKFLLIKNNYLIILFLKSILKEKYNSDMLNNNNEEEEPIYEDFFTEKQSEHYDMILDFSSFNQLKQKGWTANFSPEGYKKYLNCKKQNINAIGVIGDKNRGKSFLLGRIIEEENYVPPSGFLVTTYGISCNFPKIIEKDKDNQKHKLMKKVNKKGYLPFITLDTAGKDNPLLQNAYSKNNDIQIISRDQKITEIVLSDFIIQKANILIAVVEQLTFAEQEMLKTLIERLKQREIEEHEKRKLVVIHNLMNISTIKGIEDFKKDILLKSLTFELKEQYMGTMPNDKFDDSEKKFYIQTNLSNDQEGDRLQIYHFIFGNDLNSDIKKEYNDPALRYIRDLITVESQKTFDIIKEFQEFIIKNSQKYLYGDKFSGFSEKQLIIGEKQERKVYIDKEKKKTIDKIIVPIVLTDQSIIFEPRKFKYDGDNYIFLSNIEPRYSAKIIKKHNEEEFLEIIFEMFGKVTILNPIIDYNEDNNQIIITIRGETAEAKKTTKTLIKSNSNQQLKYTNFDFQVKILKIISQKNDENENNPKICYEIDIQEEKPFITKYEKTGMYQLLFPIKMYEQKKNE